MRLLGISIGVLLIVGMALLSARIWGLSVGYQRFEHPFLTTAPLIAVRVDNLEEAKRVVAGRPDVILWLDLRKLEDAQFLVLRDEPLREFLAEKSFPAGKYKGPKLARYTLEEIRPVFPQALLLPDAMKAFPEQRFILNVADNVADVDLDLVKTIEPLNPDKRVLVQSDTDVIIKLVKEKKPMWLYGTSWADLMRLMSFESLWLESAAPYRGDVFIAPLGIHGRPVFNDTVLAEVRRRQKTILLGPLMSNDEVQQAKNAKPDGFVFDRAELLSGFSP